MRSRFLLLICFLLFLSSGFLPAVAGPPPSPTVRFQVLVVGGTPAGIAAAVAAARAGMRTVLIEDRGELGGDITGAWLNTFDMNWGPRGENLTRGIFLEVYRKLGQTFDISRAREVFDELVASQPNLTVMLETRMVSTLVRSGTILGVTAVNERKRVTFMILADAVIDATDIASVAAASDVPYTVGREESGIDRRMQAATLIFRLAGVDRAVVAQYLIHHEKPLRRGGINGRTAWGYSRIVRQYRPRNPRIGLLDLNLGWQSDGTVLVNALQIFDVDGTDVRSIREARLLAVAELPHVVDFLRTKAPGFEKAELVGVAPHLYIRETRHIVGFYRMQAKDILQGKDFWDRVAIASYPIDLHPYALDQRNVFRTQRRVYAIPFRVLVPRRIDHLLVVGKGISASYSAYGSLRVIPTAMALGEAAGEAAALAVLSDTSPHRMVRDPPTIGLLQQRLIASGGFLPSPRSFYADKSPGLAGIASIPAGDLAHIMPQRPNGDGEQSVAEGHNSLAEI